MSIEDKINEVIEELPICLDDILRKTETMQTGVVTYFMSDLGPNGRIEKFRCQNGKDPSESFWVTSGEEFKVITRHSNRVVEEVLGFLHENNLIDTDAWWDWEVADSGCSSRYSRDEEEDDDDQEDVDEEVS